MDTPTLLYLSRKDVEEIGLSMREIIDALESMFQEKGEGRVEMPPKPGIHPRKNAFIHAMPAYIPKQEAAGMKWIAGYPENYQKGLPQINGLLILNDPETGLPLALMDATWLTAMRTGAATAVAAKYLARKDSSTVGIVACGVQGRSNLEALVNVFKIQKVKTYDIVPESARKFADEMGKLWNLDIEVVSEAKDAVTGLDIVVTSGPVVEDPKPPAGPGWLSEGSFASAVDFDSYWQSAALEELDKLATDDHDQLNYYRKIGPYFKATPVPYADLGEIVAGKKPGRESDTERTMAMNLGIALDDMATAVMIYKKAREKGVGTELPL